MAVFVVEVLAIYELPGVNVTNPRRNQRDQDLAQAATQSDRYQPGGVAPTDEYLEGFDASRYGFGWRGRQFVTVQQTATDLGTLVFNQLVGRNLKDGSKVQVFADHRDEAGGTGSTGSPLFQRFWPRSSPSEPDIG